MENSDLRKFYKILDELELKIGNNAFVNISIMRLIGVETITPYIKIQVYWPNDYYMNRVFNVIEIEQSNVSLEDHISLFAIECKRSYSKAMGQEIS